LEYEAEATEFFKSSNNLNGQILLNSRLEAENIECSVSPAMSSLLMVGSFLWKNPLSPSGFASSVLSSEGIFRSDTLYEGMVLELSTKFDMSQDSLKKLTKTQVVFPVDAEEMIHRIRGLSLLSDYFFKKSSFLSQGLEKLVNFCLENKIILKTRIHLDSKFIPKFLCAIDERIYIWLKQCSNKQCVTDTDVSLVNFDNLTTDIQLNRFNYFLPPAVAEIDKSNQEDPDKSGEKKRKVADKEKNSNIRNDWKLLDNESWANFNNKSNEGPTLSMGCKPCLKYQVKGLCYSDCKHKESHKVLNGDDAKLVSNYLKKLRRQD
jgi:hypothetical protein